MTNDEAIYTLKNTAFLGWSEQAEKVSEAVRMAVEALKTQLPKEDTTSGCISRQEAIRIASGYCHPANVAKELAKLPSVQQVDKDINVSCKDAISRQGAIDHFKSIADATSIGNKYNEGFVDGLNFAVEHLKTMPSVQPEPKWIPCKDRLPERGNEVLVCYDFKGHRSVLTGVLYGDGSFHGYDDEYLTPEGRKYRKAVAWMPLPEPYEERRER